MDQTALLRIIAFDIPENLVIISLACSLLGVSVAFRKKIVISIILAILFHYIRNMIDSFIIYSLLNDIALILFFRAYKVSNLFDSAIAILISGYTYLAIEFSSIHIQQIIFHLDPLMLSDNFVLSIVCFLPQLFIASILGGIIHRKKISILNLNYSRRIQEDLGNEFRLLKM